MGKKTYSDGFHTFTDKRDYDRSTSDKNNG